MNYFIFALIISKLIQLARSEQIPAFYTGKCTRIDNQLYFIGEGAEEMEDRSMMTRRRIYSLDMTTVSKNKDEADWKFLYQLNWKEAPANLIYTGPSVEPNKTINIFWGHNELEVYTFDTKNKLWELKANAKTKFSELITLSKDKDLPGYLNGIEIVQNNQKLNQLFVYGALNNKSDPYFIVIYDELENTWKTFEPKFKLVANPLLTVYNNSLFIFGGYDTKSINANLVTKVNLISGIVSNLTTSGKIPNYESLRVRTTVSKFNELYFASLGTREKEFYSLSLDSLSWSNGQVKVLDNLSLKCMTIYEC